MIAELESAGAGSIWREAGGVGRRRRRLERAKAPPMNAGMMGLLFALLVGLLCTVACRPTVPLLCCCIWVRIGPVAQNLLLVLSLYYIILAGSEYGDWRLCKFSTYIPKKKEAKKNGLPMLFGLYLSTQTHCDSSMCIISEGLRNIYGESLCQPSLL